MCRSVRKKQLNLSKFMMDMSSAEWLSDLAMEEDTAIKQHCEMMMMSWEELNNHCLDPSDLIMDTKATSYGLNTNQQAENNNSGWSSCASSSRISAGKFISFGNSADEYTTDHDNNYKPNSTNKKKDAVLDDDVHGGYNSNYTKKHNSQQNKVRNYKKYGSSSVGVCSQEHVVAERKRREKMTQRFHALSALVPGLTKMDKASILNDAAKYLKQLEEQVKMLEEQTANRTIESFALVKSSKMVHDPNLEHHHDGNSSSDDNSNSYSSNHQLLEIEARACNKNVLIRIHSRKDQHLVRKVLNEIEKLHLTSLSFNTIPFGGFAMDITIVAQMDDDFGLKMKDLVMHLRLALQQCT